MEKVASLFVLFFALSIFGGDQWTQTGKHPAYPSALYFVGVGMSERGAQEAKQASIVEVQKQISSRVKASVVDEQKSLEKDGKESYSNSVSSYSQITSSGELRGIQVVQTAKRGNIHYALAVLEKDQFSAAGKLKIKELKREIRRLKKEAEADIAAGKIGEALRKIASAKSNIRKVEAQRVLISAALTLGSEQALDITRADFVGLIEKCVSGLKMEKVSGDNQEFALGLVPAEPFVVKVTAEGVTVSGVRVKLLDEEDKTAMEKYTNNDGVAEFSLGDKAEVSSGKHKYTARLYLQVSSKYKRVLEGLDQKFRYKVVSNPCGAKIVVKVPAKLRSEASLIERKMITRLGKYDITSDKDADKTITVSIDYKETGSVQGVSASRTFVKTDVTADIAVAEDGKQLYADSRKAKGTGSTAGKSVAKAVSILKLKDAAAEISKHICNNTPEGPKKKIAVFPFKSNGTVAEWYQISESITDMIITKLINTRKFDVVERVQMQKIMKEKELGMSGLLSISEEQELAELAGAELMLIGAATMNKGRLEVDARIIDLGTGVALSAMHTTGYYNTQLRDLADDIVKKIKIKN